MKSNSYGHSIVGNPGIRAIVEGNRSREPKRAVLDEEDGPGIREDRRDGFARAQWKRIVNKQYGWVDEPTLAASIRAPEFAEGFRSFVEKRPPSWVPSQD